jgi:monooxygenase
VTEHFDVLIVGAGLSGISAAYHLQTRCPDKTFAVLEARDCIGGTWDLFRYPGVRSDSDMFTLGYRWKPWRNAKSIADGASILEYVREAARETGVERKIRFQQRMQRASWSSDRARWTLEVETGAEDSGAETRRYTCNFLYMCTGYYRYAAGYDPHIQGQESFEGRIVHPQHWPSDLSYAGKRVVVIGSGATAMTLVPELARDAEHVVMLQRSPTYVFSAPASDPVAEKLRKSLPPKAAYSVARWKSVLSGALFFRIARRAPRFAKESLLRSVREALGPSYDVAKHFTPRYGVWEQRVCLIPDGDLFESLRSGRAEVVTDQIDRITPTGISLKSGQELAADLIVKATGLELEVAGGCEFTVDGRRFEPAESFNYKGCMFTGMPNFIYTFGYTNASWTLKADLIAEFVCRLLRQMQAKGADRCMPRDPAPDVGRVPWLDFSSSYVKRALSRLPSQGAKRPYRLYQNYLLDLLLLRYGRIEDGVLELASMDKRAERAQRQQDQDQDERAEQALPRAQPQHPRA